MGAYVVFVCVLAWMYAMFLCFVVCVLWCVFCGVCFVVCALSEYDDDDDDDDYLDGELSYTMFEKAFQFWGIVSKKLVMMIIYVQK